MDLLFNLYLIYRSFVKDPEIKIESKLFDNRTNKDWPTYTILCPMYKEAEVIPQFVESMKKLDYPKRETPNIVGFGVKRSGISRKGAGDEFTRLFRSGDSPPTLCRRQNRKHVIMPLR